MAAAREPRSVVADAGGDSADARDVARGVCRTLGDMGYSTLTEMRLATGRRVDVIGLDRKGIFAIVEIKVSVADLRGDRKWSDYLPFCDVFYFAIPAGFPREQVPADAGLIIADRFGGAVARPSEVSTLAPARRRAQTLRFARIAADRMRQVTDPAI